MKQPKCRICRRVGTKLFLKGEKCSSPKCPFIKRPYPPGPQKKKRRFSFSEYAKELREKQKLKNFYGLTERQFSGYVKEVLQRRGRAGDATLLLIHKLESRLDNAVFRLGFARSRGEARELVSHSHFLVNQKRMNIPSFQVKKGDVISLKETKKNKPFFKNLAVGLKNFQTAPWLKLDVKKLEGKVTGASASEEAGSSVDIPAIFEFYSR